ncbi:MAG TPA: alpha/beta fold hydrolase [Candidatus Acidoferrum sp.]|nr:alpha/beta fold hydrolase [Candidatus Acidoferrum sp.]
MGRRIFVLVVGLVLVAAMGNSRSLAALGMSGGAAEESEADTVRSTLVNGAQPRFAVPQGLATTEGDFVVKDFGFRDGESLAELRLHYATLGKPIRDSAGHVVNGVMLLHGTGGSGAQFLQPQFAGELFGAGQLLDTAKYYIILPDGIGHGKSSKPSDGLHATFPQYDYDDMVAAHHALAEHLGVEHLRLILGTSMGCMHSFVWGETYPEFMDALMPLACQPAQIAGRNRIWRKMVMDAIRNDPEWKGGEYAAEPRQGLRTALDLLLIAGSAPLLMQKTLPTRDAADKYVDEYFAARMPGLDANDLLYQVAASRNYDPLAGLEKIRARVMYVNSADDFINPPELGIAEREIRRVAGARFVVIPISDATHGHGTHTWAAVWKSYLAELLAGK